MSPMSGKAQSHLRQSLKLDDFDGFAKVLDASGGGIDWDHQYNEDGGKTILQLALEADWGYDYVKELLRAGATADGFNKQTGTAPIHTAAVAANPAKFKLLMKKGHTDINIKDKSGLSPFNLLLAKLLDLGQQQKMSNSNNNSNNAQPDTVKSTLTIEESNNSLLEDLESVDEQAKPTPPPPVEELMSNVFDCLILLVKHKGLRLQLNTTLEPFKNEMDYARKKMCERTPLQLLCSFQNSRAPPIIEELHIKLGTLVAMLLAKKDIDPNATGKKIHPVTKEVTGSNPALLLAATRGYYRVIEAFKAHPDTNFLPENKLKQNVLHIVLYTGYYYKLALHGKKSEDIIYKSIKCLFDGNNPIVQKLMRRSVNATDLHDNSVLHYAKFYPTNRIAKLLLSNGAKVRTNPRDEINVVPKALEEHFSENCITAEGDDIDDEAFAIRINYRLFDKFEEASVKNQVVPIIVGKDGGAAEAAAPALAKKGKKKAPKFVDVTLLEHLTHVDNMMYLLSHPVVNSFLVIQRNEIESHILIDLCLHMIFVACFLFYLCGKYGMAGDVDLPLNVDNFVWTPSLVVYVALCVCLVLLIFREIRQLMRLKCQYFQLIGNYIEWFIILLLIANLIPDWYFPYHGLDELQRHLGALTLIISFMNLYALVWQYWPISSNNKMFTTVMQTYIKIMISYLPYLLVFAFCFYLLYYEQYSSYNNYGNSTTGFKLDPRFATYGLSIMKTIDMFNGNLGFDSLLISNWMGYIIVILCVFLLCIVLMNVLNGLAVTDIQKIRDQLHMFFDTSLVEALTAVGSLPLLTEEVIIYPNKQPEKGGCCCFRYLGTEVHYAKGGKMSDDDDNYKRIAFGKGLVGALKELVALNKTQEASSENAEEVTLETLRDKVGELSATSEKVEKRLAGLEVGVAAILDKVEALADLLPRNRHSSKYY